MYRFDHTYAEEIPLPDGTVLKLRLIRPEDKALLAEGLRHLSRGSRYRRFLADKSSFSAAELHYLTEVDEVDHVALVAFVEAPEGGDRGVAVARFVRLPGEPAVAEPAIVVLDAMQNRGIGSVLLQRLSDAARERGIEWFECVFLADNHVVLEIIQKLSPDVHVERLGSGAVRARISVPDRAAVRGGHEEERTVARELLSYAANRMLNLWNRIGM